MVPDLLRILRVVLLSQRLLTEAVDHMSRLDYDAAAELAPQIEQHSHEFR
jgi:hypothetical protein